MGGGRCKHICIDLLYIYIYIYDSIPPYVLNLAVSLSIFRNI